MKKKDGMPVYVYVALLGIKSRNIALRYLILSLFLSGLVIYWGISKNNYLIMLIILIPLWYWLSIKWVDNNSTWSSPVSHG